VRPQFFLGTHLPGWLSVEQPDGPGSAPVPLFVSDRRLRDYKTLPRARAPWALDSGGFTELSTYGSWDHGPPPKEYAARVRRYADEIGHLVWVAPQDWMCEPWILAKTGLSVEDHQRRTTANFLELRNLLGDLVVPVVQGDDCIAYLRHRDAYDRAGVDLGRERIVGVGSVCRRQATAQAGQIFAALRESGVPRLHGFGLELIGLTLSGGLLMSADSMAWSYAARRELPLSGCTTHINCANCFRYAHRWYRQVLGALDRAMPGAQPALFPMADALTHATAG